MKLGTNEKEKFKETCKQRGLGVNPLETSEEVSRFLAGNGSTELLVKRFTCKLYDTLENNIFTGVQTDNVLVSMNVSCFEHVRVLDSFPLLEAAGFTDIKYSSDTNYSILSAIFYVEDTIDTEEFDNMAVRRKVAIGVEDSYKNNKEDLEESIDMDEEIDIWG